MVYTKSEPISVYALTAELRFFIDLCNRWQHAWNEFPDRLRSVLAYLNTIPADETEILTRVEQVRLLVSPLQKRVEMGLLTPADLPAFTRIFGQVIQREKQQSDARVAGSLYSLLHGKLENIVHLLNQGLPDICLHADRLWSEAKRLLSRISPTLEATLISIRDAAAQQDIERLREAARELNALVVAIPVEKPQRSHDLKQQGTGRRWTFVSVEDDPVWQEVVRRAIEITRTMLGTHYTLTYRPFGDRKSAQDFVQHQKKRKAFDKTSEEPEDHLLAIVDLGIPAHPDDDLPPSRDEGLSFLQFLRSNRINLPTVVLTTPANFLSDHLTAAQFGVSDYLLKGTESEEQLVNVLTHLVTWRPQRTVRILHDSRRLIEIDGIEVRLPPQVYRVLQLFFDAYPEAQTVQCITRYLEYELLSEHLQWETDTDLLAINLKINWAEAKRNETDPPTAAVEWLQRERYLLWRKLKSELQAMDVPSDAPEQVMHYLDSQYGGHNLPCVDANYVEKLIYEARHAIKQAFNAVGQAILPEEEFIVNTTIGDEFGYQIAARVVEHSAENVVQEPLFRVLVVENDIAGWQIPITRLLHRFGYTVRSACCIQEAMEVALSFRPHVLCLDMHIPENIEAFQRDPMLGVADGGLRVLEAVREWFADIRAVALTDLADQDDLRVRAHSLGLRVTDFISKRGPVSSPWETELILRIHRIEQELRHGTQIPLTRLYGLPYLRLYRSRQQERYVEAFNCPWSLSENQYRLLCLLAQTPNRPVPTEIILKEIYGDSGEHGALKQLIKNFRKRIAGACQEWFGIGDPFHAANLANAILINDAKIGYILNARVTIEP